MEPQRADSTSEMRSLADRWQTAFSRILEHYPDMFRGSDLDPSAVLQRMEKLVSKIESYLSDMREPARGSVAG